MSLESKQSKAWCMAWQAPGAKFLFSLLLSEDPPNPSASRASVILEEPDRHTRSAALHTQRATNPRVARPIDHATRRRMIDDRSVDAWIRSSPPMRRRRTDRVRRPVRTSQRPLVVCRRRVPSHRQRTAEWSTVPFPALTTRVGRVVFLPAGVLALPARERWGVDERLAVVEERTTDDRHGRRGRVELR